MSNLLLATAAAISPSVGTAHAAEGNGDPIGLDGANLPVVANPNETQTGQAAYPRFSRGVQVAATVGGMMPAIGSLALPSSLASARESATCGRSPCIGLRCPPQAGAGRFGEAAAPAATARPR